METFLQLLLEAPLTQKYADIMLNTGNQVSIFYNKKWIKVEPVKTVDIQGIPSLVAYEVGKPDKLFSYEFDKITNWNLLNTKKAERAFRQKKRDKRDRSPFAKAKKPTTITPAITEPGGGISAPNKPKSLPDAIKDAINNKRIVSVNYAGDKEEPSGWRLGVEPFFYGTATEKRKGVTPGQNYVRVWVGSGKSVTGDKNPLPGWRFFREDRIIDWKVDSTKTFKQKRPGFNETGDKVLDRPLAIAKFINKISESKMVESILEAVRIF
jgi:hypothetical protein